MAEDLFKKDKYYTYPFIDYIYEKRYKEIQDFLGVSDMKDEDLLVFIVQSVCDSEYRKTDRKSTRLNSSH